MATHYPSSGWLRLDSDTLTALGQLKAAGGHTSFDETVWSLLVANTDAAPDPVATREDRADDLDGLAERGGRR